MLAVVHVTGQAVYAYLCEPGRTAANCNPDCNPGDSEDPLLHAGQGPDRIVADTSAAHMDWPIGPPYSSDCPRSMRREQPRPKRVSAAFHCRAGQDDDCSLAGMFHR